MRARWPLVALFLLVSSRITGQAHTLPQENPYCFDLAVLAGPPVETMVEGSSDPRDIIGHPLWKLDITVDRVLIGQTTHSKIRALLRKHTEFNPKIREHLFLLKARPDGEYDIVGGDYRVIKDNHGQFIIPMAEPRSDESLFPDGPLPHLYQDLLKPVQYPLEDGWWLANASDWELEEVDPAWGRVSGRAIVALRGLYLDDWARAMRSVPGALCTG